MVDRHPGKTLSTEVDNAFQGVTYSQCTPERGNDVMANGMRRQQKLQNFV